MLNKKDKKQILSCLFSMVELPWKSKQRYIGHIKRIDGKKSKDDLLFLVEESEAYDEGFVCFSHEAVIKRSDIVF